MVIVRVLNPQATIKEGPYYRMRPDGKRLGRQLALDPMLRKLNSANANRLPTTSIIVVPAPRPCSRNGSRWSDDFDTVDGVIRAIAKMGSSAGKQAVPVLIGTLRAPNSDGHLATCMAHSRFDPATKDVLPAWKELKNRKGLPAVVAGSVDVAIQNLRK